ncbi:MAG: hypothetical protein K5641_02675 [Lachnospiraceae bacterium]|nr:hypothetical protein [Lachnospiraceae bacterium]
MKNTQLYPFERNRYYAGKMLTTADFQAEQAYFNNKRRFINRLMCGSGIVCGFGVFSLDDLSVLIESGVAIDELGREIVMDTSVVKKLSVLEGFESLKTNEVSLCLRYNEEEIHSIYAVNQRENDKEYEYNRISESYTLYLVDTQNIEKESEMETEFLTNGMLYAGADYSVELILPATVSKGRNVKAVVRVSKLSSESKKLTFKCILQTPAFNTPEGQHEILVDIDNLFLNNGETYDFDYWMETQNTPAIESNIILKSGSVKVLLDGKNETAIPGFSMKVSMSDTKPYDLIAREIGRMSLEMKNIGGAKDYIRLADLKLVRTESAYLIEEVRDVAVKKYITSPAQDRLHNIYMDFFRKDVDLLSTASKTVAGDVKTGLSENSYGGPEVATGILEIPLGEAAKKGDIRYSGEIMHGLGKGNVYVEIGYEYIAEDPLLGTNAKSTIYGNPDLFKKDRITTVDAETAVKVLNDKGSFVVAAKLLQNVDYLVLTYRWVAIKFPAGNDLELTADFNDKSISAETPTVVLGTKESHFFGVKYHNMESCSIAYELTESGSGEITADGVYTAPAKEGVYEIRIYCTDMPIVCTYAYAIVKKKGVDDAEMADAKE